jgi:hypothetical protein
MRVIAGDLRCQAIRVSGRDPARLSIAAQEAAAAGLEVWLSPFPVDLDVADTLDLFADCAERAEALRRGGVEMVLMTGCDRSHADAGGATGPGDVGELREFGGMPEGVPVFEIVPGPRKHRRVFRGDRIELVVRGPEGGG